MIMARNKANTPSIVIPSSLKGKEISQITGYINRKNKAKGQLKTNRIAHIKQPIHITSV